MSRLAHSGRVLLSHGTIRGISTAFITPPHPKSVRDHGLANIPPEEGEEEEHTYRNNVVLNSLQVRQFLLSMEGVSQ